MHKTLFNNIYVKIILKKIISTIGIDNILHIFVMCIELKICAYQFIKNHNM